MGEGMGAAGRGMGVAGAWRGRPTFFLSSTLMALASLRKMALPHSRSRSDVNWYHFHFRKAHSASSHSRSVHWTVQRGGPVDAGRGLRPPGSHQLSRVFGKGLDRETCLRERPSGPTAAAAPPA